MGFYVLLIGAMFGFMIGYLMGFCKADNMHHRVRNKKPKLDRYGRDVSLVNQARAKATCKPHKLPPSPPKRTTLPSGMFTRKAQE